MRRALITGFVIAGLTASLAGCNSGDGHKWDVQKVGNTPVLINHDTGALYVIDGGYKVAVQTVSTSDLRQRSYTEPGVLGLPLDMHVKTVYRSGTLYWSANVSPEDNSGGQVTSQPVASVGPKAASALASWKRSVSKTSWMDRLKLRFSGRAGETIAESDIKPSNTTEITDSAGKTVSIQETGSVRVSPGEYKAVHAAGLVYSGK